MLDRMLSRAGLALVSCLVVLPAFGGEGRIPIWEPTTITESGKYVVTRNIRANVDPIILVTGAETDVDIDLNGFTLDSGGGDAILAFGPVNSLVVHNGTVIGGNFGTIDAALVNKVVVEDVQVFNEEQCGILLDSVGSFVIRRNIISGGICGIGVVQTTGDSPYQGLVEDNAVRDSGVGILLGANGSSVVVRNNRIESITDIIEHGIQVTASDGLLIAENVIQETFSEGIRLEQVRHSKIVNNVISQAGGDGILLTSGSDDNLILDNNSSGSTGGSGLAIEGDRNQIRGNVLNANFGFGIHFLASDGAGAFNTYGRNTARGNGGAVVAPCTPVPCGLAPDHCDEVGATNDSFGDNLNPGPPAC